MASVSSLDQDMRNLRLSKYTPQAANEIRSWIEQTLGETLPPGDLLQDVLKDGVILCKLANLALPPPGLRFKKSAMPFVQMENISHFLRACESPPLNMAAHDRFLTVDLFESKDPAQVLQCISAFSRVAHAVSPANFPSTIGPQRSATLSPAATGPTVRNARPIAPSPLSAKPSFAVPSARPMSPALSGGSSGSRASDNGLKSSRGTVSSWTKAGDRGNTAPAWNIAQYGYMGGASQGNQGVMFGGRRQITTAAPHVPGQGESGFEKRRREKEAEEERLRQDAEEAEYKRKTEREAEEERDRVAEEQKWEEEARRTREQERQRILEQKRQWEEQERRWKIEEEARQREQDADTAGVNLKGQYLSQHQADQGARRPSAHEDTPERQRVRELEKQLEEARERERQYQQEREDRVRQNSIHSRPSTARSEQEVDPIPRAASPKDSEVSWAPIEDEVLNRKVPAPEMARGSTRPLPTPTTRQTPLLPERTASPAGPRPLPDPSAYRPASPAPTRTDRYLADHPAPVSPKPVAHQPREMGYTSTYEEQGDRDRRLASQQTTKAGGWASKSLLEREMERERERQREWEANQQASKEVAKDMSQGSGAGQSWDVHQYGYMGGDSQNRGSSSGSGIGFGGRRQIIGPRPPPGS
ncbi:hypothetical protein D6D10_03736 [Aureobasidium pullulans]|uniref:Calponin-homology (CH) domain-containing protein n=1 Tax=Aureobasidium pullulans TaxID=5580 RepID=A0A4S9F1H4_AURPU|nr:hypothetical protein D6D10_03736 [Aureobasidium pullulans]